MQADRVLKAIIESSECSSMELSRRIGRAPNYLSVYLAKGTIPGIDLLAETCTAAGQKLVIRKDGHSIAEIAND